MDGIGLANRRTDAATRIKWDATVEEYDLMAKIAERATKRSCIQDHRYWNVADLERCAYEVS